MYISLKLELTPKSEGVIYYSGKLLRAFFLRKIAEINPEFAEKLHRPDMIWGTAPYAITPLNMKTSSNKPIPLRIAVKTNQYYEVELKLVEYIFKRNLSEILGELSNIMKIGEINFKVKKIKIERKNIPENLIKKKEATREAKSYHIYFRTPTYFRQVGTEKHYMLPTPEKFIYSATKIWNTFSEKKIDKKTIDEEILPNISVKQYRIKTVKPFKLDERRKLAGFIGNIKYVVKTARTARLFKIIVESAKYTNVGGNRTGGFGVVEYKEN